jgi:hypothetical protein
LQQRGKNWVEIVSAGSGIVGVIATIVTAVACQIM